MGCSSAREQISSTVEFFIKLAGQRIRPVCIYYNITCKYAYTYIYIYTLHILKCEKTYLENISFYTEVNPFQFCFHFRLRHFITISLFPIILLSHFLQQMKYAKFWDCCCSSNLEINSTVNFNSNNIFESYAIFLFLFMGNH